MCTFTEKEIDRIKVDDNQSWDLPRNGTRCFVKVLGLEPFAERAFGITAKDYPDAVTDVYVTVDAVKRAVIEVWFSTELHKHNAHDRTLDITVATKEGRLMFVQMMKGANDSFTQFIRKMEIEQTFNENRNNSDLWWQIMVTDERTGRKNSSCLQGTVADCEKKMIQLAKDDRSKYASDSATCFTSPQNEKDLEFGMEGSSKLQIKGFARYVNPFESEYTVNYTATARI